MKIRRGFVSNSSSSSFCILGSEMDYETYSELEENEDKDLGNVLKEIGLEIVGRYDECYSMYIGLHPEDMKDEETLLEFKNRIREGIKKFKEIYGISIKEDVFWVTDGWYSG